MNRTLILIAMAMIGWGAWAAQVQVTQIGTAGLNVRAVTSEDMDFALTTEAAAVLVSAGGTTSGTDRDCNITTNTTSTVRNDRIISISDQAPGTFGVIYTSIDEDVATVDANGYVSRVSDGTARILVRAKVWPYRCERVDCVVSQTGGQTLVTLDSWVAGTLGKAVSDGIDGLIDGTDDREIYSASNHTTGAYTRNASGWAAAIDLTCVPVWNSQYGSNIGGALVSPCHLVTNAHVVYIPVGAQVRFVDENSSRVTRTIASAATIEGTDIRVCKLDADVPESVGCAKVLPSGWEAKLPGIIYRVPCVSVDREQHATVREIGYDFSAGVAAVFVPPATTSADRHALYEPIESGDSGYPCFWAVGSDTVLLACWQYGGGGSGPNVEYYATEINAAMGALGGGYALTAVDLSGYTTY
jgi:hypothetical protein